MSTLIVDGPRWLWMWVVAITIYALLKALSWHDRRVPTAPAWRHWAYLLTWPGMNANRFLKTPSTEIDRPGWREWAFAFAKMILGISLLCAAVFSLTEVEPYLRGWVGMLGLVFSLHFGLFHLLSCVWRTAGVSAPPLMNWPIASESLAEFWGRRWNLAFRDLAYRFLFVPLQRQIPPVTALLIGFVVSGLIHDVVISWPAGSGYGWPTGYFAVQGLGIVVERSGWGHHLGFGRGIIGWCYVLCVVLLPCGWLFHRPFVCDVIVPFLDDLGGL